MSWEMISIGLDQLWFTPLSESETIEDRSETIEKFLKSNHWTWDKVLDAMGKENHKKLN